MKPIRFLGDSLKMLSEFPESARKESGYQLRRLQEGKTPDDFKPIPAIGKGVEEIRVWMAPALTESSIRHGWTMRFTSCMLFRRRLKKLLNEISKPPDSGSPD